MIRVREWRLGRPVELEELSISRDTSVCLDILLSDGRSVQIVVHDNPNYADYLDGAILVRGYRPATDKEAAAEAKGLDGPASREVFAFNARLRADGIADDISLRTRRG